MDKEFKKTEVNYVCTYHNCGETANYIISDIDSKNYCLARCEEHKHKTILKDEGSENDHWG